MAVRIRMKRLGRTHRPFFRICAMDSRAPRDGRVIEELGFYDPMVRETDARAQLNGERIDYWLSVGAQPTEKVKVLIKKYGTNGTHLEQQKAALERMNVQPEPVVSKQAAKHAVQPAEQATATATEEAPAEEQAAESSPQAEQ